MNMTPANLARGLALFALAAAWAWLAHQGSAGEGNPYFAAALATLPVVAIVVMLLWRAGNPLWPAAGGLAMLGLLAWLWPALRQKYARSKRRSLYSLCQPSCEAKQVGADTVWRAVEVLCFRASVGILLRNLDNLYLPRITDNL